MQEGNDFPFILFPIITNIEVVCVENVENCGSACKESTCNMGDLGWEDPLEKGKATHSSILAWRIPWTENSMGSYKRWTQLSYLYFHFHVENLENSYNLKMENKIQLHVHHPEITKLAFCSLPFQHSVHPLL